jgi:hypothetical protein
MKLPIRLFCPAEATDWSTKLQSEREVQLCKDIASRLGLAINLDEEHAKLFLGRVKSKPKAAGDALEKRVRPQSQSTSKSCGQCSVAMAITLLTGSNWTDLDIAARYGYELLSGLNAEVKSTGWGYTDHDFSPQLWGAIEAAIDGGAMVIIALNGPEFSPSGYGHILGIVGYDQANVRLVDPNGGYFRTVSRHLVETCPPHRQGKWCFVPAK